MVRASVPPAVWRRGADYAYLLGGERTMFAWEWLRRSPAYRDSWARTRSASDAGQQRAAEAFGLVALVPPSLPAPAARPLWRAARDPHVLPARVAEGLADRRELLDIRALPGGIDVGFDSEDAEHWRIEIAGRVIRVDVRGGTLLGGPTLLRFELTGLAGARPKLPPLDLLARAGPTGPARAIAPPREARARRWIAELRTADALEDGATQQDIARALFGRGLGSGPWRGNDDSQRLRAQRLVRIARARLRHPLDPLWFR